MQRLNEREPAGNITILVNGGYPQLSKFITFMDRNNKPKYWVSPILINFSLGDSLSSLMKIIRLPDEKRKYIKSLAEGGFKKVFDFVAPVNGHQNKFIIKFESLSTPKSLQNWCNSSYDGCTFLPTVIKSEKYKDNYNQKNKRVCIINTPAPIVESFFSLLNTKYSKEGVSPCLLKTYFSTLIDDETCTKADIECLKSSMNRQSYDACLGNKCKNVPLFNDNFTVNNSNKMLNGKPLIYIDGRYVVTIQEKIDGDLIGYTKAVPNGLTHESFCSIFAHICLTLHILQTKNTLMHNDFWFRNIFFIKSESQRVCHHPRNQSIIIPLNSIKYFKYSKPDDPTVLYIIKQSDILPIISDFGYSEFTTENGEYICNKDFGLRSGISSIPGNENNKIRYVWYSDIVLFLTSTLHTLFNNTEEITPGNPGVKYYQAFIRNWSLKSETGALSYDIKLVIKQCMNEILTDNYTSDHQHIFSTIIMLLLSIFLGKNFDEITEEITTQKNRNRNNSNTLLSMLNNLWKIYFYPNEAGNDLFEKWIVSNRGRSVRINFTNYGTENWKIKRSETVLSLFDKFYKFCKTKVNVFNNYPSGTSETTIFPIFLPRENGPKFTVNLERSRDEWVTELATSFKPPPNLRIYKPPREQISRTFNDYGLPTYIKPIDSDSRNASVIYYAYENIQLPGLSIKNNNEELIEGDNKVSQVNTPQYINLIVIKNPSNEQTPVKGSINFKRQQLINTLINIFNPVGANQDYNTNDVDYTNTKWGVAFSGGFFKHIDYTSPTDWIHCNNVKDPLQLAQRKCFEPIGYVRNPENTNEKYNNVPEYYKQIYGSICLKSNNQFELVNSIIENNETRTDCRSVLTTGALLTYNDTVVFDKDKFDSRRFKSLVTSPALNTVPTINRNGSDHIIYLAGWLNHAFNLNPRAAIGMDREGNIYLVTVEGRMQRGAGCDLVILANIMKGFGCVSSINLDGGGTADLLYKLPDSACYIQTNPLHIYRYPFFSLENSTSFTFTAKGGGSNNKKNESKIKRKTKRKLGGSKSKTIKHKRMSHTSPSSKDKSHSFSNPDNFHSYNIKHNSEYKKLLSKYEHDKKAYINAPITHHDLSDVHILDDKKARIEVKKIREQEFDKYHQHPKFLKYNEKFYDDQ
jgi:hypothetical protein